MLTIPTPGQPLLTDHVRQEHGATLKAGVARLLLEGEVRKAREEPLISAEHFTLDWTLIEAWAGRRSSVG